MGLMFVVGALPRCLGPSWSLYELQLRASYFRVRRPCPKGGRTCLEFGISALIFGATPAIGVGRTPGGACVSTARTTRAASGVGLVLPRHS